MKQPRSIKQIGRKRRTLGWTLLTLSLLVAGVWFEWWGASATYGKWDLSCFNGLFISWWSDNRGDSYSLSFDTRWPDTEGLRLQTPEFVEPLPDVRWNIGIATHCSSKTHVALAFVLWPIPLLLFTPAALLLRSGIVAQRRAMTNACAKCGYDLAGLASDAPCPECGKAKA